MATQVEGYWINQQCSADGYVYQGGMFYFTCKHSLKTEVNLVGYTSEASKIWKIALMDISTSQLSAELMETEIVSS